MRTGRQDHTAVRSSIALLQERFRRLERVREIREGRELLKKLVESSCSDHFNFSPDSSYDTRKLILLPELISPPQVSLSLWSSSTQSRREDCGRAFETHPCSTNLRQAEDDDTQCIQDLRKKIEDYNSDYDSGVDTSLHL